MRSKWIISSHREGRVERCHLPSPEMGTKGTRRRVGNDRQGGHQSGPVPRSSHKAALNGAEPLSALDLGGVADHPPAAVFRATAGGHLGDGGVFLCAPLGRDGDLLLVSRGGVRRGGLAPGLFSISPSGTSDDCPAVTLRGCRLGGRCGRLGPNAGIWD